MPFEVEKAQQEFQKMCQAVKEVLGPKVDKVVRPPPGPFRRSHTRQSFQEDCSVL